MNIQLTLKVFGSDKDITINNDLVKVKSLGFLTSEEDLIQAYQEASISIAPSVQEAFGQTVSESLACGTPVIIRRISGGPLDLIEHGFNGFIVEESVGGLEIALKWYLEKGQSMKMSEACKLSVLRKCHPKRVSDCMTKIYTNSMVND